MSNCDCPDCSERSARYAEESDRRVKAALAATSAFTVAGLEQIGEGGYSERLALLASLMMEEVRAKADDAEINRRLRQLTDATGITNEEQADAEAFRGSRGD